MKRITAICLMAIGMLFVSGAALGFTPVSIGSATTYYTNDQYGIQFEYSNNLSSPYSSAGIITGGTPSGPSNWTLSMLHESGSLIELMGYTGIDYDSTTNLLKSREFITNLVETSINGHRAVTFYESGMTENKTAIIFNDINTLAVKVSLSDPAYEEDFDKIVNTFSFSVRTLPLEVGDVFKLKGGPAIYKIGFNGKRRLYPNAGIFWSWYSGTWSDIRLEGKKITIKEVSQFEFSKLSPDQNITVKTGYLIQFKNSPKIYTVFNGNKIKYFSTAELVQYYGDNWLEDVVFVQPGFETNYMRGEDVFNDANGNGMHDDDETNFIHI